MQNKRQFFAFCSSAWLNRACLHLYLLLWQRRLHFLLTDIWANCHKWTATINRVEKVPCFFRYLSWVSPWTEMRGYNCNLHFLSLLITIQVNISSYFLAVYLALLRTEFPMINNKKKYLTCIIYEQHGNKHMVSKWKIIPCFRVKWPFLFTEILVLSTGPGGSLKINNHEIITATICAVIQIINGKCFSKCK